MTEQKTKKRRGCLFYLAIIGVISLIVMVIGGFFGLRYARSIVNQLTDLQPMTLPTVTLPEEEMLRLKDRIEDFRVAVQQGEPTAPLALTDTELNALISSDPDMAAFRNHLFVTIVSNQLQVQMSMRAEDLSLDALRGRYINASGTVAIALKSDGLNINAQALSAKGKPVPGPVMRQIGGQNLAQKFNNEPRVNVALNKLQEIKIADGKLLLVPK
ncbi:MAG: hypothetical protein QOD03_1171, partial [Verrucomicrobiota bacterium]